MKKGLLRIVLLLLVTVMLFVVLTGCYGDGLQHNTESVAYNDFGFSRIYFVAISSGGNGYFTYGQLPFANYVLGEKENGEFIIIVVPAYERDKPYEVEWPFNFAFLDAIAELNEITPCNLDEPLAFSILDSPYDSKLYRAFPTITEKDYDFCFFIRYLTAEYEDDVKVVYDYYIGQKDGELVFYLKGRDFVAETPDEG